MAKEQPTIYLVSNSGMELWIDDLSANYNISVNSALLHTNLTTILNQFKSATSGGYILCDDSAISTNVALSLCGLYPSTIVITPDIQSQVEQVGISLFMDVRGKDTTWLWQTYQVFAPFVFIRNLRLVNTGK